MGGGMGMVCMVGKGGKRDLRLLLVWRVDVLGVADFRGKRFSATLHGADRPRLELSVYKCSMLWL